MDLSALQHLYESIPEEQKSKFVLGVMKWLLGKGWKKLTAREKKKAAAEAGLITRATMADIEQYDPAHERLVHAIKRAGRKSAAAKKGAPPAKRRAAGRRVTGTKKRAVTKKATAKKKVR